MAVKNKEVNLTAVLLPSQVGTVTYIWWIGNNTEVVYTQDFPTSLWYAFCRLQLSRLLTLQLQNARIVILLSNFWASRLQNIMALLIREYQRHSLITDSQ